MKKRGAYYSEWDPFAAQWIRNLIKAKLVAPGEVDERSITKVQPEDLKGFAQVHAFAGIAGWSYALRLAGWEDDREAWTGSAPCQPWSVAGKQGGAEDERHLYPAWSGLIRACRPKVIFGEQVASADVLGGSGRNPKARAGGAWFNTVQSDLEDAQYTVGAVDLPAAGVGAPHIRQRLWFVADTYRARGGRDTRSVPGAQASVRGSWDKNGSNADRFGNGGELGGVADRAVGRRGEERANGGGLSARSGEEGRGAGLEHGGMFSVAQGDANNQRLEGRNALRKRADELTAGQAGVGRGILAYANGGNAGTEGLQRSGEHGQQSQDPSGGDGYGDAREVNGQWRDADWLLCRDKRWRPVEPGTFPLAYGVSARVGQLRAYGNAIVPQVAAEFVKAYMECRP